MKRIARQYFVALVICVPFVASAQEKQRFANMDEAMQASGILRGRQGPQNVNWIEGGARFSYTDRDASTGTPLIRAYDPPSGKDAVLRTALVTPPVLLTATGLPKSAPFTWNWTVPVGVPLPGGVTLTTAASTGETLRLTIVWKAPIISAAATTGSIARWGMAPWAPRP